MPIHVAAFPLLGSRNCCDSAPLLCMPEFFSIGHWIWIVELGENRTKSQRISRKGRGTQVFDCCLIHEKFSWLIAAPSHVISLDICVQFSSST